MVHLIEWGVDVLKLPKTSRGHQYAVVFVDYLTKWPEVFAVRDQTAPTIAKLLTEKIIPRHGVPTELLSDRGANFLSNLLAEVYSLMGIKKVNTTAYHPQTDGLVERFNRTLTDMLAKTAQADGKDWDQRLPYVLFAYRSSPQTSTGESPFYLLYGRDPQLPMDIALSAIPDRSLIDVGDYKTLLSSKLSEAWKLARKNVEKAQFRQKKAYDIHTKEDDLEVGDRVFVYMPAQKQCVNHKLVRPFHGPYRIVEKHPSNVTVRPIDQPKEAPIRVSLSQVRKCPSQIPNEFWPNRKRTLNARTTTDSIESQESIWTNRLRNRTQNPEQESTMNCILAVDAQS